MHFHSTPPCRGMLLRAAMLAALAGTAHAQQGTVPSEGIADRPSRLVALVDARAVTEPGTVTDNATIVLRDGRIESVARGGKPPAGAEVRDLAGKTVFAGFVDPVSTLGLPDDMRAGGIKPLASPGQPPHEQTTDQAGARHWNRRVRPEWSVADRLDIKPDESKNLRALGYTAVLSAPQAGIVKGQGAVLSLRDGSAERDLLLARDRSQHLGFDFAYGSEYPGSLMGAIALIRQTLLDARWQHSVQTYTGRAPIDRAAANAALDALYPAATGTQRVFFQLDDELDVGRVAKIDTEFGLDTVLIGTGFEYRVLPQVRAAASPFVLPLNFPDAPDIENAEVSINASLADLQHWEQAPANAARVAAAGVEFAFTTHGIKEPDKQFWNNLRRAVRAGLSEDAALRALTVTPAALIGEAARLGRIAPGQLANLVVADAALLRDDNAAIYETWVEGERFEHKPLAAPVLAGDWTLAWADGKGPARWRVKGSGDKVDITAGSATFKASVAGERLVALPPNALFGAGEGGARIAATMRGDAIEGYRDLADGRRVRFTGTRTGTAPAADTTKDDTSADPIPAYRGYPAGEYARDAAPARETLLITNATVWTNTDDGVLTNADVLVRDGKIAAVGIGLAAPSGAKTLDAGGRHVTPGIIDAHSHTAIARNVNEPSHAVTTEVRVADVIDPTDIDIYRQLAGGVTTANLLHGSANPMGGQNAVIKLRWGADADGLLLDGAKPGVKFALGENVKQSGWGDSFNTRYPQTRMGVEQIMRDHFNAALAYDADIARKDGVPRRRDLRLEALAQIVSGERQIHIHSYRQDEILMFVHLAKEYGIPGVTFQHILEGYKVADAMAGIGAGASTFADWWAYKMEVYDGIPHNGALMTRAGVVSSFNSDSNEMARRLNMEAAKAVKYGGLSEEEALKLVTLNPAKQLAVAERIGALAPGMDADLVLWSDHPLSNYARADLTFVDGRRYFDREQDRALQQQVAGERERLLQKIGRARLDTLALKPEDAKDAAKAPDPALVALFLRDRHAFESLAPSRSVYHNGADLQSCGINDHVH
ncbi:amidohydrolase family protein [Chiayiivirga flava]|uniref:Imidazolonepropionase-like amidohydrolase n=1 Tax=Chiayiivirga flava TaxID=659595 RepID=A0A7W8G0R5_9GAMM|nr:amidohydrolase family protein [Chiayiivirga flava]MBB5209752.1 imidazolonepropionase-like amidohydrolase [Chiayiivirga flava]